MRRIKMTLFLFCVLTFPAPEAQNTFWEGIGKTAGFGKPFWADMHSNIIRTEIAYGTNSPDYDYGEFNTAYRPYIFMTVGADVPLWSGNFSENKYGFSVSLPLMIETWYDRFEKITSPIINVGWWFGVFDFGFIYRMDSPVQIIPKRLSLYNYALKFTPLKHESTHLGDELIIYRKDEGFPITRLDVLKNFAEIIFVINDPDNQYRQNHGLRLGALFNYQFKRGWYRILEIDADPDFVKQTWFPFEFFAQYQYQSNLFGRGFQAIASAEYRLRERFNYGYAYSGNNNKSYGNPTFVNCFNFFGGIRFDNQKGTYFSKTGIGLRYYYGLNPYGQFRSMPRYQQWGIAVFFE